MTGPENYREAAALLEDGCTYGCPPHAGCGHEMAALARAQAHATLAVAAAVIDGTDRLTPADRHEWQKAIDPEYAAECAAEAAR